MFGILAVTSLVIRHRLNLTKDDTCVPGIPAGRGGVDVVLSDPTGVFLTGLHHGCGTHHRDVWHVVIDLLLDNGVLFLLYIGIGGRVDDIQRIVYGLVGVTGPPVNALLTDLSRLVG